MTILEDLWYGNVRPTERSIVRGSKLDNLMKLICQNEDDLMIGLTDKQKESFEKFKDCQSEITDYLETEAFTQGFTIAVKLMVEVALLQSEPDKRVKRPDGGVKCLTPRQAGDVLGHSTSQITEMYYVKRDNSRLIGITDNFEI